VKKVYLCTLWFILNTSGFFTPEIFAQEEFRSTAFEGQWLFTSAVEPCYRPKEGWGATIKEEIGNVFEFSPKYKINGKIVECGPSYEPQYYLGNKSSKEEIFETRVKHLTQSCRGRNSDPITVSFFEKKEVWLSCDDPNDRLVDRFFIYDSETLIGNAGGDYTVCLKRIDVQELELKSQELYTTEKPETGKHLFAFDFPFTLPATLPVSQGNADKRTTILRFKKLNAKGAQAAPEIVSCTYKGGSPVVKKGEPRPISKEFTFHKFTRAGVVDSSI
jgi:hypothetical protein